MFRNPRERDGADVVLPSVGRPPSPHRTVSDKVLAAMAGPVAVATPPTPRTSNKPTAPPKKSPAVKTMPAAKGMANGSILSFFKKVDPSQLGGGLFLEEDSNMRLPLVAEAEEQSSFDISHPPVDQMTQHTTCLDDRYHESGGSVKRRKLSPSLSARNRSDVATESDKATLVLHDGEPDVSQNADAQATIPPVTPFKKHAGPFLDDSDSDDSPPRFPLKNNSMTIYSTTTLDQVETNIDVTNEATARVSQLPDPKSDSDGVLQEDTDARNQQEAETATAITTEQADTIKQPAHLKHEATSHVVEDEFGDMEGLEEFEDEEYDEGEEFTERRWMREQRRLELEAEGLEAEPEDEDLVPIKEEPQDDEDTGDAGDTSVHSAVNCCPVCSIGLDHVTDSQASIHVNNCLDGNPTPLPARVAPAALKLGLKSESSMKKEGSELLARYRRPVRPAKPGQESPFTFGKASGTSTAFSKMMSGHAEDEAWAVAAAAENAARGKPAYQRTCPFYKILPGFFTCVDAFRYGAVKGCNAYFLSHFHSDHYVGLTSTWCHGPIYCSRPTANLVKQQLRVDPKFVIALKFEEKVEIPGTDGVFVTMIPANHCPGSSIYLFEKEIGNGKVSKMQRVLHCGDFRACPAHVEHPLLKPEVMDIVTGKTKHQKIDVCYLDTTYLNPRYAFPSQEDVIQACADMCVSLNKTKVDDKDGWEVMKRERAGGTLTNFVRTDSKDGESQDAACEAEVGREARAASKNDRGRLLVIVGTYSIGKERICLGIARALGSKIYAPPGKQRICAALEDQELNSYLTSDPRAAQVHMTPLFEIRAETLGDYLADYSDRFSRAVGFRPSGWNYRPPGSRFTESPAVGTVLYSDNWKSGYSMRELVPQRGSTSRSACYGVPYSEHSSFRELTMFCCALRIDKIIPTVNVGSAKSREKMKLWCERWAVERKKNGLFKIRSADQKDGKNEWYPGKGTWELRTTL